MLRFATSSLTKNSSMLGPLTSVPMLSTSGHINSSSCVETSDQGNPYVSLYGLKEEDVHELEEAGADLTWDDVHKDPVGNHELTWDYDGRHYEPDIKVDELSNT